jgi:hypothetical protein
LAAGVRGTAVLVGVASAAEHAVMATPNAIAIIPTQMRICTNP